MERFDAPPRLSQEATLAFQKLREELGKCQPEDSPLFLAEPEEWLKIEEAKAICRQCGMIFVCRQYALANGEPAGVWGGQSEAERQADLLRQQNGTAAEPAEDYSTALLHHPASDAAD